MKLLREPLLHFVVLGGVLFGLFSFVNGDDEAAPGEIVVTSGQIASLQAIFTRTWQRPPTAQELEALLADHIRDEVLYREALAMGLDRDDVVIKRRMRQKLEFVADVAAGEPTDAELKAYVAANRLQFQTEPRFSLDHVYFSSDDGRGQRESEIESALKTLRDEGKMADPAKHGDRFMPGYAFEDVAASDVVSIFGADFASSLQSIGVGRWSGPVASAYGLHLVLVRERAEAAELPFADIRDLARRELHNARRIAANDAIFEKLRSRYVVRIEPASDAPSDDQVAEATP